MQLIAVAFLSYFQVPPARSDEISLSQCIERIHDNSVQLAQAMVSEARAQAALSEARGPMLPQLVAQGNLATTSNILTQPNDANKAVIRIEQGTLPFDSAWKLGNQRSLELEATKMSRVETLQDVQYLVKQLYFAILRDQDAIENLNTVELQFRGLLSTVLPKFQIGRAPSFDLVKVKSSIYDLARTRELLRSQLVGEKSQLGQIVGVKDFSSWTLRPVKEVPSLPGSRPDIEGNPTLLTLTRQIDASDAAIGVAKAARVPALSAAFEYGLAGQTPDTTVEAWSAYAQLRFTIFDWGLISAQIDQAEAAKALAERDLEARKQQVMSELAQTQTLAEAHLSDEKRLSALMPELRRAAIVSVSRYRQGAIGIIEATDSIGLWLQNLNNERAAHYGYLTDLAHLERLTGGKVRVQYGT